MTSTPIFLLDQPPPARIMADSTSGGWGRNGRRPRAGTDGSIGFATGTAMAMEQWIAPVAAVLILTMCQRNRSVVFVRS